MFISTYSEPQSVVKRSQRRSVSNLHPPASSSAAPNCDLADPHLGGPPFLDPARGWTKYDKMCQMYESVLTCDDVLWFSLRLFGVVRYLLNCCENLKAEINNQTSPGYIFCQARKGSDRACGRSMDWTLCRQFFVRCLLAGQEAKESWAVAGLRASNFLQKTLTD